jgi:hypothetical protein
MLARQDRERLGHQQHDRHRLGIDDGPTFAELGSVAEELTDVDRRADELNRRAAALLDGNLHTFPGAGQSEM